MDEEIRDDFMKSPELRLNYVVGKMRNILKSKTKLLLRDAEDYLLDGLIEVGGQATIYYAIHHMHIYCAKVADADIIRKEFKSTMTLKEKSPNCKTILYPLELIDDVPNHAGKSLLIFPYVPFILSSMPIIFDGDFKFLDYMTCRVAICILSSIIVFFKCGLVHGDIKLGNIGYFTSNKLDDVPPLVVLFDFGSTVEINHHLEATTDFIGLDFSSYYVTTSYDLACLATTLGMMNGIILPRNDPKVFESNAINSSSICSTLIPLILKIARKFAGLQSLENLASEMKKIIFVKDPKLVSDYDQLF